MSSEEHTISKRETTTWSIIGALLAIVGLYAVLHGGVALLGGMGNSDRHVMDRGDDIIPSRARLVIEVCAGVCVLTAGLAVRIKSARLARQRDHEPTPEQIKSNAAASRRADGLNAAVIVLSLLWITYILLYARG